MDLNRRPGLRSAAGNLLSGAYRRAYWWSHDRRELRAVRGIRTVLAFGESLGDNLMCTQVLAGLQAAGRGPLAMLTPFPDLFEGLPFPVTILPFSSGLIAALGRYRGAELILASYGRYDPVHDRHLPPQRDHFIVELCRTAGLSGAVELKPLFRLTAEERRAGAAVAGGHILIQSSAGGAKMASPNKEWYPERWQAVVDALAPRYPVTQVGTAGDPLLAGVVDRRGQLSRREVAAALAGARVFLGPEGFLMHLARAVDCRSVIVIGGRSDPRLSGYPENSNLFTVLPCSPCWHWMTCDFDRECMRKITPEDVLAAAHTQLSLAPLDGPGAMAPI